MANVQNQTRRHNDSMRQVTHVNSYNIHNFFNESSGNLLITGGLEQKRHFCLLDYIINARAQSHKPVIVFTDKPQTEQSLISLAQQGLIGQFYVCSPTYKGYSFFKDMRTNLICDFFNDLALDGGAHDITSLDSFTNVLLSIVASRGDMNLYSICGMAHLSDAELADLAQDPLERQLIQASSAGGVAFRNHIHRAYKAFSEIATDNPESDFCISKLVNGSCEEYDGNAVILVNIPTYNHKFFSLYFAKELEAMLGYSFTCIFDDSIMLMCDKMRRVVELMKQRSQITLAVSHENVYSLDDPEEFLRNFNRNIVLLNGNSAYSDLQNVLDSFGEYTHMDAMVSKTTPQHLLFSVRRSEAEAPVSYQRSRVLIQEESNSEALLKGGSSAEIVITRRLRTQFD